jgi:hypothetical protein
VADDHHDDPDRDSREFLSNFLACSEVDLSDLQSIDNLEDFFLILSSREGTQAPAEGSWNFKKVAAVLVARTAIRREFRGSQLAAAGSGGAGGSAGWVEGWSAGWARTIPSHATYSHFPTDCLSQAQLVHRWNCVLDRHT